MSKKNDIEAALIALAKPGMSSKQLQKDIAKAFPKASKKRHPPLGLWRNDRHRWSAPEEVAQLQDLAISKAATPGDA